MHGTCNAALGALAAGAIASQAGAMFISNGDLTDGVTRTGVIVPNPNEPATGSGFADQTFWELWTFTITAPTEDEFIVGGVVTTAVEIDVTRLVPELDAAAAVYRGDATGLEFSEIPNFGLSGSIPAVPGGFQDDTDPNPFGTTDGQGNPLFFGDPRINFETTLAPGASQIYSVFVVNFSGGFLADGYPYEITTTQEIIVPTPGSVWLLVLGGAVMGRRRR